MTVVDSATVPVAANIIVLSGIFVVLDSAAPPVVNREPDPI